MYGTKPDKLAELIKKSQTIVEDCIKKENLGVSFQPYEFVVFPAVSSDPRGLRAVARVTTINGVGMRFGERLS
jgi:hypothetical protein